MAKKHRFHWIQPDCGRGRAAEKAYSWSTTLTPNPLKKGIPRSCRPEAVPVVPSSLTKKIVAVVGLGQQAQRL